MNKKALTRQLVVCWRSRVSRYWPNTSAGPMSFVMNPQRWEEWEQTTQELLYSAEMDIYSAVEHIKEIIDACYEKGDIVPPVPSFFITQRAYDMRLHRLNEKVKSYAIAEQTREASTKRDADHCGRWLNAIKSSASIAVAHYKRATGSKPASLRAAWRYALIDPGRFIDIVMEQARCGVINPEFISVSATFAEADLVKEAGVTDQQLQSYREQLLARRDLFKWARDYLGDELWLF